MNTDAYLKDSWDRAANEGTEAYERGQEFATCPYARRTIERQSWEAAWRVADFKRKELIPEHSR